MMVSGINIKYTIDGIKEEVVIVNDDEETIVLISPSRINFVKSGINLDVKRNKPTPSINWSAAKKNTIQVLVQHLRILNVLMRVSNANNAHGAIKTSKKIKTYNPYLSIYLFYFL